MAQRAPAGAGTRDARPAAPVRTHRPAAPMWDIAVPTRPLRLAGVAVAGFSDAADAAADTVVDIDLVPHPAVTLLFDLGGEQLVVEDGAGQRRRGHVAAGLAPSGARGRGPAGSFACLQVRLSPPVAHAVLGGAAAASGAVVALDDVWGRGADRIVQRLRAAGSWDERFAVAEAELGRRLEAGRAVDPETGFCWRRLVAARGRIGVEALAAEVGWSRKRLWSRFGAQIGLTPKRAARLVRFDRAAHHLAAGRSAAAVAAECGYVDQSHLHRDVLAFTGATPTAVAAAPFLAVDDVAWPGSAAGRG